MALDLLLPEEVDEDLIKDLVVARSLLNGQPVRGRWTSG